MKEVYAEKTNRLSFGLTLCFVLSFGLPAVSQEVPRDFRSQATVTLLPPLREGLFKFERVQRVVKQIGNEDEGTLLIVDVEANLKEVRYRKEQSGYRFGLLRFIGKEIALSAELRSAAPIPGDEIPVLDRTVSLESGTLRLVIVYKITPSEQGDCFRLRGFRSGPNQPVESKLEAVCLNQVDEFFVGDITNDNKPEVIMLGSSPRQQKKMTLWTVERNGILRRILFVDGSRKYDSVEGNSISFVPDVGGETRAGIQSHATEVNLEPSMRLGQYITTITKYEFDPKDENFKLLDRNKYYVKWTPAAEFQETKGTQKATPQVPAKNPQAPSKKP